MKKRIISIVRLFVISFAATAQVPTPPTGNNVDTRGRGLFGGLSNGTVSVREKAVKGGTPTQSQGPVGTATALLISLGAGAVAYKVRKNRKEDSLS